MSKQPLQFEDLSQLLAALCDGTLDGEGFASLERLLTEDPAARRWYLAYMELHGELCWNHMAERQGMAKEVASGPWLVASGEGPRFKVQDSERERGEGSGESVPLQAIPPSAFPLSSSYPSHSFSFPSPLSSLLPTTPLGNVAFSYAMSAVLVGIGLFIFSLMSASSSRDTVVQNKKSEVPRNHSTPNVSAPTPEPQIVSIARITGMVDCVWVNTGDAPFHDRVVQGAKYMLKSGLMEITYRSGAKVILQGPCTYEVESVAGGYLSLGKLTARVESKSRLPSGALPTDRSTPKSRPAGGTYFAVRTPTATVTDLGTEFGVEVSQKGETQSHVYRGRVELRVVGGKGKDGDQVIPLGENESASVTLDKTKAVKVIHDTSANPSSSFVRGMPRRVPIKLFNTGVGLKPGDADPHWQLVARSDNIKFKPVPAVVSGSTGSWMPNEPSRSQWISLVGDCSNVPDGVVYTFRTTFQLTEAYLGTAVLRGMFAADNHVRAIRLNGHELPVSAHDYDEGTFVAFHIFSSHRGFVEGANVLEIDVDNGGDAVQIYSASSMGLRVELEGSVVPHAETSSDNQPTAIKN